MLIKTQIDPEQLVDLRVALNSLDFALARLSKLDKNNFAEILGKSCRLSLLLLLLLPLLLLLLLLLLPLLLLLLPATVLQGRNESKNS